MASFSLKEDVQRVFVQIAKEQLAQNTDRVFKSLDILEIID